MTRNATIHIGFPKTGTTTIQQTLAGSRNALMENGVIYPGTGDDHSDLISLFHPKGQDHYYFEGRQSSDPVKQAQKIMSEALDGKGDVVLSSEYLHNIGIDGARRLFDEMTTAGFETKFLCYLRHPVDAAVSSAQQSIKMGQRSMAEVISEPRYTKIRIHIQPLIKAVGKENIIIKDFNAAAREGLVANFMTTINHGEICDSLVEVSANESITMDGAILADMHRQYHIETGQYLFPKSLIFKVGKKKFDLPPKTKAIVQEDGQVEVDWVLREFGVSLEQKKTSTGFHPNPSRDTVFEVIQHVKGMTSALFART